MFVIYFHPVGGGKEHHFYPLIGVLRLCAGDDRLDELLVRRVDAQLRGVLCRGPGLDPVAHHRGALLTRPATQRYGHSCIS